MINVSSSAAKKLLQLKEEEERSDDAYLRVYVEKGGCSGFKYKMDFEDGELKEDDKLFQSDNAKVVVDSKSLLYLLGMTLEYEGGLNGKGFIFSNPNANKSCSCGISFNV
ncbi:MAG: iron-sulfur cluster assembly accessory protein [Bdellovibrionaceae bacterium]|jgi:iron-sulfur cluster assembly protein|nr:iron-sulfur cluster assembly accessory protein [Pseudobdellovibrionaceae bacterium]